MTGAYYVSWPWQFKWPAANILASRKHMHFCDSWIQTEHNWPAANICMFATKSWKHVVWSRLDLPNLGQTASVVAWIAKHNAGRNELAWEKFIPHVLSCCGKYFMVSYNSIDASYCYYSSHPSTWIGELRSRGRPFVSIIQALAHCSAVSARYCSRRSNSAIPNWSTFG